jgi:hypothetical protein
MLTLYFVGGPSVFFRLIVEGGKECMLFLCNLIRYHMDELKKNMKKRKKKNMKKKIQKKK